MWAISDAVTGHPVQPIGRVEVHARLRRPHFHDAPASGIGCPRRQRQHAGLGLVQHEIVVVAMAEFQLPGAGLDVLSDGFRFGEIKRCARNSAQFAGRDQVESTGVNLSAFIISRWFSTFWPKSPERLK